MQVVLDPRIDPVGMPLGNTIRAQPGQRPQSAHLSPPVSTDHLRRNAVQPGPHARARRIVALPLLERLQEDLRGRGRGSTRAEPLGRIPVPGSAGLGNRRTGKHVQVLSGTQVSIRTPCS